MKIAIEGRQASIIYTPWFNRILMSVFLLAGIAGSVWVSFAVQGMDDARADLLRTFQLLTLFLAGASFLALLLSPSKAYVFDKGQGRGVFSIQQRYVFGTFQKKRPILDVSHAEADRVKGDGPEAYWLRLILKNGKKIKFKPIAFTPEKTRAALEVIDFGLSDHGGVCPGGPVPGQSDPVPLRTGFGRRAKASA